jgi:hypothetical protein
MRPALVAALLVVLTVAGCSDPPAPKVQEAEPEAFEEVEVTDTTGAIRGVAVNEAIVPIPGVLVALNTGQNASSDEQGAFVFNGLEPGTYFLTASKAGYSTVQQSAEVVAGDKEPPVTKIQLLADASTQPYTQLLTWEGFLQCGFMLSGPVFQYAGANACGPLDGRFITSFDFDAGKQPDHVQAEAVWDGTQPLSNDLTLGYYYGGTSDWKMTYGHSPLILPTNKTEYYKAFEDDEPQNMTALRMRVFPGRTDPAGLVVTTNQAFKVYLTYFYGFKPREGWAFINDGPCSSPDLCS